MKHKQEHDGTIGETNPWPKNRQELRRYVMGGGIKTTEPIRQDPKNDPLWWLAGFAVLALVALIYVSQAAAALEASGYPR